MANQTKISQIHPFIHAAPIGQMNSFCAGKILTGVAEAHGGFTQNIILDLQQTTGSYMITDHTIWEIVEVMKKFPKTFCNKLGLINKNEASRDREEFFVHCAKMQHFPVKVFTSTSLALAWFAEIPEPTS